MGMNSTQDVWEKVIRRFWCTETMVGILALMGLKEAETGQIRRRPWLSFFWPDERADSSAKLIFRREKMKSWGNQKRQGEDVSMNWCVYICVSLERNKKSWSSSMALMAKIFSSLCISIYENNRMYGSVFVI